MIRFPRYAAALALAVLTMPVAAGCAGDAAHQVAEPEATAPASTAKADLVSTGAPVVRSPGKRGAPVTLGYHVDGKPQVGVPVAIELDVRSATGDEVAIALEVSAEPGLEVTAGGGKVSLGSRSAESRYSHRLVVTPRADGLAHVHVVAVVAAPDGRQVRTFAVPVTSGDGAVRATKAAGHVETDAQGRRVRVLPATDGPDG